MHCSNSKPASLRLLVLIALTSALSLTMAGGFRSGRIVSAQSPVAYKTFGIGFSPYLDGQDPNLETVISEAQLRARMQVIANHTVWVRSFGSTHGLEKFGLVAHSLGLKAAAGAWLSTNLAANNQEIANLINAANAGQVDLAIVGSEVLLRNDLSESQLIAYMNQVRQQIPANIPVATADAFGKLLEHQNVIANSDVVLPNYYPYWQGVSINTSIATLNRQHQQIVAAAQGKPVIVSETGWPSAGNVICNAVPSPTNASLYFLNFVSWARANNVSYFYFSAFDEAWKSAHEGPQGAHWGVWDKDGVLKAGMQNVFDGATMADNWTSAGVPGGPGTPAMEFAYVPPYGSTNNLFGQVLHVNTDDYRVAVYIYVGGWWTKPTFANPLTSIGIDGGWECDITTGENDALATKIVAYLVPKNFSPPAVSGDQTLPPALDQNAVAKTEIDRSSSLPFIAGRVTDSNNQGLNCVTISMTGSRSAITRTLSNGNYSFLNLPIGGNYTVTPSHPSYTFNPSSLIFNNLAGNQTGNFVALPPPPTPTWEAVVLSAGQTEIKTWTSQGRTYVYVKLLYPNAGYRVNNWGTATRSGNDFTADAAVEKFTGTSVQAVSTTAQIYDLGPLANGTYNFNFKTSGTQAKTLQFTLTSTVPPPNPIDDARQFVRQQYRDFLNREPDTAGWDFWTDNITKCNDPARRPPGQTVEQCTLRQRETTSGAFFLSPEFQYTGYYVYRIYQGALGRQPKLSEFLPDAQFVGNGIIVNGQLSGAVINQNKAAFAAQFVNCTDAAKYRCAEFKAIYDPLNNTQYVDKLFLTTGVNANASDRTALVNGLNGGSETRASVLQKVVDGINVISEGNQQFTTTYGKAFYDQQFTRAFVQLEYFGYMKRDPDEAGYNFWLAKLNQFGGDFVAAEMVLAFISSPEYRARFGQP